MYESEVEKKNAVSFMKHGFRSKGRNACRNFISRLILIQLPIMNHAKYAIVIFLRVFLTGAKKKMIPFLSIDLFSI